MLENTRNTIGITTVSPYYIHTTLDASPRAPTPDLFGSLTHPNKGWVVARPKNYINIKIVLFGLLTHPKEEVGDSSMDPKTSPKTLPRA